MDRALYDERPHDIETYLIRRKPPGELHAMAERPRVFDDLASMAGGAVSALSGLRDEAEALMRARVDETIRRLDLVRREEFEAVAEMAARARTAQEDAEARLAALETHLASLEARLAALEPKPAAGPGMMA
jgi:BMFP domain-containing protein YqiC